MNYRNEIIVCLLCVIGILAIMGKVSKPNSCECKCVGATNTVVIVEVRNLDPVDCLDDLLEGAE